MNFTYNFLKNILEENLLKMKGSLSERIRLDPIFFPHLYNEKKDIEIAAFLSAQFAYGTTGQIKNFLTTLFSRMGKRPYDFVSSGRFSNLYGLFYRFQKDKEIIELFSVVKSILDRYGTIGELFHTHFKGDLRKAIFSLRHDLKIPSGRLLFFFPTQSLTNPLKRWNLFLRWMVRKDEIDFGMWEFIKPRDLIVPLDAHIFKIGRCLGFTERRTKDAKTAIEITEKLRLLCPEDPLRYDFLLCHFVGIGNRCAGERTESCMGRCILYG